MGGSRISPELPAHLERLYGAFPYERSLGQDPLGMIRPWATDLRSAETLGILASVLAIGTTASIRTSIGSLLRLADGSPLALVEPEEAGRIARGLRGFRHRWIRGDQIGYLLHRLTELAETGGTLESVFTDGFERGGFAEGLDGLARTLRGPDRGRAPRGYRALFPSPLDRSRSACKRLTLFVRWMRRTGYPDLGRWHRVPTGELRIPLDLHVYWIAYHLGLTRRRTRTWATVEEVTEALRRIDPVDPVRFDFVLCHTGISGDCPKRRDLSICGPCAVRPDCRLWRGTR
ncbi:MAG: DUF2400 family protein [Thermoplasmata archaeon]